MLALAAATAALLTPPRHGTHQVTRRHLMQHALLSSALSAAMPRAATAAKDCMLDCEENCNRLAPRSTRYCESSLEPTLPRHAWTLNMDVVEGSVEDSYRFNPWRAPGRAPVVDPCGQAGGEYGYQKLGGDSVFYNTSLAKMGDMGSNLPKGPSMATWKAGGKANVSWGVRYNHG